MSLPFFFNFFAVGDIWSAMDISMRDRHEAAVSRHLSFCATYLWTLYVPEVFHSYHLVILTLAKFRENSQVLLPYKMRLKLQ